MTESNQATDENTVAASATDASIAQPADDEALKKAAAVNVARNTMRGDLRDVMLDILRDKKYTGKSWKDLKEDEQKNLVARICDRLEESIVRAIDIIHSDGQKHIKAVLKQVTVKDGYKGVFECGKNNELRHELTDAQGSTILVVLTNAEAYMGEDKKVKFDKDQPDLPVDNKEKEAPDEIEEEENGDAAEEKGSSTNGSLEQAAAAFT